MCCSLCAAGGELWWGLCPGTLAEGGLLEPTRSGGGSRRTHACPVLGVGLPAGVVLALWLSPAMDQLNVWRVECKPPWAAAE